MIEETLLSISLVKRAERSYGMVLLPHEKFSHAEVDFFAGFRCQMFGGIGVLFEQLTK
jgi:hypothetical protein